MLLLYTEEQLHTAYKVFVRDYVFDEHLCPSIEVFRQMFEEDENIQALASEKINEH
tara:strand:+ start:191 stop:358 length:168 start_codon:yes stop_codon:yes gene_type:complete